jgi:hypothetical protein
VSKQRLIVCVVAACLAAGLATACAAARATQLAKSGDPCMLDGASKKKPVTSPPCRESIYDTEAVLYGGDLRTGLVHFRIAYDHDVDPEHRKAFQGGMALWNAHSQKTGFVFEDATSATIDIRLQRGAPAYVKGERPDGKTEIDKERIEKEEQAKCAEYVSTGSYIWYSRNILRQIKPSMNWRDSDVERLLLQDGAFRGLAKIYAHELGHALNLDHKSTGDSLMRQGDEGQWCRDLGGSIIADIQPRDVQEAHDCACHVRRNLREPGAVRRP